MPPLSVASFADLARLSLQDFKEKAICMKEADRIQRLSELNGECNIGLMCIEPSLHAALLSIEPFRAANRMSSAPLFNIDFVSVDGDPIRTARDIFLPATATVESPKIYDLVLVHCAYAYDGDNKHRLFRWLRKQTAAGAHVCGFDVAPLLMAEAGLLDGYRATSHWASIPSFKELHPDTDVVEQLFVVDRNRSTCAGQTACLDYSLFMLDRFCGRTLRDIVANEIVYTSSRSDSGQQRQIINGYAWHTNPKLLCAQKLMQETIEEPLPIHAVAERCGVSQRELQHLFRKHLKASPKSYYLTFRLQRARELLLYSTLSVRETGLASGFTSSATYFRAFRARFNESPLNYRKSFQAASSIPDGRRIY